MEEYFVDYRCEDAMNANIIDLETLEAAERGENYLNPDDYMFLGDFDSMEDARNKHAQDVAWSWYCKKHDC